jgi:hypothetical protein
MTCLEAIVAGQCNTEVADYITMAVVPEEDEGTVQVAMDGLMNNQLSAWIAIAGEGEATALEAQLRATQCFMMDDAALDAAVMMTHPAADAMISDMCLGADGASDAVMRYNAAFATNDADARLAKWIDTRLETVRAQTCDAELVNMENELLGWTMTSSGLLDYQSKLYHEFFSSLTSTTEATVTDFIEACDAMFAAMGNSVDMLEITGPAADAIPCGAYQEMTDVRT